MNTYRIRWLGETVSDVIFEQELKAYSVEEAVGRALTIRRRCLEDRYLNEDVAGAQGFFVELWST